MRIRSLATVLAAAVGTWCILILMDWVGGTDVFNPAGILGEKTMPTTAIGILLLAVALFCIANDRWPRLVNIALVAAVLIHAGDLLVNLLTPLPDLDHLLFTDLNEPLSVAPGTSVGIMLAALMIRPRTSVGRLELGTLGISVCIGILLSKSLGIHGPGMGFFLGMSPITTLLLVAIFIGGALAYTGRSTPPTD